MKITSHPVTLDQANNWIERHHRHHDRVTGHRYTIGAAIDGRLVGVAICGRPVARKTDQRRIVEVLRCCTIGDRNVPSWLYARSADVARILGAYRIQTFIRDDEPGISLVAAGWTRGNRSTGRSWNQPSRPREDRTELIPRWRFYRILNPHNDLFGPLE